MWCPHNDKQVDPYVILQLILVFTQIQVVDSTCLGCEWLLPELTRGLLLNFLPIDRSNDDIQPACAFFSVTKARDMASYGGGAKVYQT